MPLFIGGRLHIPILRGQIVQFEIFTMIQTQCMFCSPSRTLSEKDPKSGTSDLARDEEDGREADGCWKLGVSIAMGVNLPARWSISWKIPAFEMDDDWG